jgi:hypothetical protein
MDKGTLIDLNKRRSGLKRHELILLLLCDSTPIMKHEVRFLFSLLDTEELDQEALHLISLAKAEFHDIEFEDSTELKYRSIDELALLEGSTL